MILVWGISGWNNEGGEEKRRGRESRGGQGGGIRGGEYLYHRLSCHSRLGRRNLGWKGVSVISILISRFGGEHGPNLMRR